MNKIGQLITETFEQEQPALCAAIKQAVLAGESKSNFERFAKSVLGPEHDTTVTFPLCLTVFDYYKETLKKP